jgi:hypothetical protein
MQLVGPEKPCKFRKKTPNKGKKSQKQGDFSTNFGRNGHSLAGIFRTFGAIGANSRGDRNNRVRF